MNECPQILAAEDSPTQVERLERLLERANGELGDALRTIEAFGAFIIQEQQQVSHAGKSATNPGAEVLVVEDSPTQAAQIEYLLQKREFRVTVAANGREGLAAARQRRPAVVISDVMMPEMDGYQLCRAVKDDPTLEDVPVILLTMLSDPEDIIRGLKAGADFYLTKPYDEGHLLARVDYLLARPVRPQREDVPEQLEASFDGERHVVSADHQRILNVMLSTYENSVRQNREMVKAKGDIQVFNDALDEKVTVRTQELQAALEGKEVLLREIHHRVKNNLQVISSLLNMQARRIRDPEALAPFQDSHNRVKSMALVHEKLYRSGNLAGIRFDEYIRDLTTHLFRSYGLSPRAVRMVYAVADVPLDIDIAVPCGLIVNELVSNALKYAFPEGREGEIRIGLRATSCGCALTVSDTGIGFPEDLDFENTSSLGLQLVCSLTRQIGGCISLDRTAGTAFTMDLPAPGRGVK